MFKYHSDMGHCFSYVEVVSKNIFFFFFFYFSQLRKTDVVLGKRWLFSIGNVVEIRPLEISREGQKMHCVAQSETCLTTDPGIASSILARSHFFVEIDHEIISTAILLPSADSRRIVVSYK